jgi:hypothetical protein
LATVVALDALVTYNYPQDGTIASYSLELYFDGILRSNGTAINWGTCTKNIENYRNVTVVNTGDVNLNVSITTTDLPAGWTLEWNANNTILPPDYEIMSWLNLTIPQSETTWHAWAFSLNGQA